MDILELKNTLSESRILLNGLDSAMFTAESRIREPTDRSIENNQTKAHREKRAELSLRDMWNTVKMSNIRTGFPEGEERVEQKQHANTEKKCVFCNC